MRKILVAAIAASTLLLGLPMPASADPPGSTADALPRGWSLEHRSLTWTSDRAIRTGDAAVEFWSGDRLLGRARGTRDPHAFTLPGTPPGGLKDLQVKVGGKRVDAAAPASVQRRAAGSPVIPPILPANPVDPGVPGPYRTTTGEYQLPGVHLSTYKAKVEMQAVVVAPKGAPGKRPLALFLHGRHWTCFAGTDENAISADWPCAAGSAPVPSYRGYLQAQQLLASQGYVTVSISANGINAQDDADADGGAQARSALVRMHLAHWADWAGSGRRAAPAIVRAAPPADLSQVLLMGHSRGGEGVNRAALDSVNPAPGAHDDYQGKVRWTIRGLLLIGPTAFGQNPQPDVPSATILPGCDGDVSDLEGQMYVDATRGLSSGRALHSALHVTGANHNYFNTEWTPGQAVGPAFDDFSSETPDPLCTPGTAPARLTPQQEQTVGATYIATAARVFLGGDDRARPLLDGSGVRARSAGPARVLSHALGGNRRPVIVPDAALTVRGARLCDEVATDAAKGCLDTDTIAGASPHFVPFAVPEPGRVAVALNGTGTATLQPAKPMPVAGSQALALRLIVPPNAPATSFAVAVTDDHGRRTDLGPATVTGMPGTGVTTSYWAQEVRLPLPRTVGTVARVEITARGNRPAWLIDAWGWQPGTPAPRPAALDRIDVGDLTVAEGDSGTRTHSVPVRVRGRQAADVRLFLTDPGTSETKSWVARVKPGDTRISVPIKVTGDTVYTGDRSYPLTAKAVRNAVVGDYSGGVRVREDDPMPKVTITPAVATATEGSPLTWTVHLSTVAGGPVYVEFVTQAPPAGPELSSTDVDARWFTDQTGEDPKPSRPLSGAGLQLFVAIEPGTTSLAVTVPTVADGVAEGAEHVRFKTQVYPSDFGDPIPLGVIDGTVTD
ncbi:hypothetical protein ACWT_0557 [Actinoplanes sp. SE50]|uniref:hypothetical protein n=1 Tax=unclassified Actinoplanes TaxID=2626549 RepID=UPI00023ECDD7|nr:MULTISPECIES: hypothetical protein [unclassified Actinoplanes]AEV81570.1 secreted protein [Actinoplanes sp. SE50/110]ATO79972.1 hypothetical protein ACWT_0557 [Actinoplanes sp. SE50]SLL97374.1 uncharacterized protein ACSP50_0577 [Actinoplanes sp. SE50/110]